MSNDRRVGAQLCFYLCTSNPPWSLIERISYVLYLSLGITNCFARPANRAYASEVNTSVGTKFGKEFVIAADACKSWRLS